MNRREQLAWLAGLVDGEGTVTVLISRRSNRGVALASIRFDPIVKVGLNEGPWLQRLLRILDAEGVGRVVQRRLSASGRIFVSVAVSTRHAVKLAKALVEFASVKKESLLALQDWPIGAPMGHSYGINWDVVEAKIACTEKLRSLMTRPIDGNRRYSWTPSRVRSEMRRLEVIRAGHADRLREAFRSGRRRMPNRWDTGDSR